MPSLDDVDLRTLLQLDSDLSGESLEEFIEKVRRQYELANVAYFCPSFRGYSLAEPFVAVTRGEDGKAHYTPEDYLFLDPAFTIGARALLPIDWARLPQTPNKKVRRLFGDERETGARQQGLTIPVRGPTNGIWAIFIATSNETDQSWAGRRHELTRDLVHIANYVHQRAYDLHGEEAQVGLNAITKREIEALEWSAEGKSIEDIALLMRISAETVKAHLDSARFKLHSLNRAHAVAKAIRAGLIQ
ncbi:helix-turn-helix transcriptional regulator [Methylocapsa acidiphila]|uniref:helix-turn-helix transcriptional regulator n=1 Tax=Methylocapsa acidiphila TaxID=133552 RepID=UPI0004124806|nr:autoinducer binding domain-containing protein [Methylocapsa acidiphila]